MRLNPQGYIFIAFIAVSGCSSWQQSASSSYKSSLYDVRGDAPSSLALPSEQGEIESVQNQSKADYHFTVAEGYSLQGDWAKAIENYKLNLVYDPNSYRTHFRLASEYVRAGLVTQALEHSEQAIKLKPDFAEAHVLQASLHSVLGLHDKARLAYEQLLKVNPDNEEAEILLGATYLDEGKLDKAVQYFEKLSKSSKKSHIVWYYLGKTYLMRPTPASLAKAEVAFKTSLKIESNFVQSVIELGSILEKKKKDKEAIALYESFQTEHGPDVSVAESLVQSYLLAENYDKAYEHLKTIIELDQGNLNAQLKMAFILVDQKKYKEAIPLLETILSQTPDSDRVRFYLGAVYEEVKDYRAAIQQFKEIPKTSKYFADATMHIAYLFKLLEEPNSAIALLEKNLDFLDDNPKVYSLYASFLDGQKMFKESQVVLEKAHSKFPKDVQIMYQLGSVYDQLGQADRTVEKMEQLIVLDKNHVEGLNYLAYLYADKTKNLDVAEKLARRALTLRPNDGFILDTLGWVLYKQNKMNDAIKTLEKAHQLESNESIIAEHLGDVYFKIALPQKAREMYERAVLNEQNETNVKKLRTKIDTVEERLQTERSVQKLRQPASDKDKSK
ncbi:MAG: tetratricopeptide repeat protein [Bdellovibrionaceae bacterium]|nr:tetratricopeptide repeat protein [Pseudobdellovibrionaceae bacterium]